MERARLGAVEQCRATSGCSTTSGTTRLRTRLATLADASGGPASTTSWCATTLTGRGRRPLQTLTHAALADSPGIDRVATFGPALMTFQTSDVTFDEGLDGSYKAVEVFKVTPSFAAEGSAGNSPNVSLRDASSPCGVRGAEAIPTMPG